MHTRDEVQTWRGQIDSSGRLLIPAESRAVMGWERGTEVVMETDGDSLRVISLEQFTREVQAIFSRTELGELLRPDELVETRNREGQR